MKVFIGKYPKKSNKEQKVKVQIDPWDTWNVDVTLAHIIVPMLKQLKATQHGAPYVDVEDVPEELRGEKLVKDSTQSHSSPYDTDQNHFKRWEYVLDEMIFAFESKITDWESQFWKTQPELDLTDHIEDEGKDITPVRWKVEGECDWTAYNEYQKRITNGFRLFGKYYEGLWD